MLVVIKTILYERTMLLLLLLMMMMMHIILLAVTISPGPWSFNCSAVCYNVIRGLICSVML